MEKISHFNFSAFGGIESDDDGKYVLASDYAALRDSYARILEALNEVAISIARDKAIAAEKNFTEET